MPPEIPGSVKVILILFYLSTFTVGIDLSKDMAKGEFEFFEGVLTGSVTIDTFAYLDFLVIDPPIIGEIIKLNFIPPSSDVVEVYRGRAPPL